MEHYRLFLAHLAKGNVSFCHHLSSIPFHILIFFETAQPNELDFDFFEFDRKHLWKVLYNDCSVFPDPLTNMAITGNSCFWLAEIKKTSPLKPLGQMNWNLVGSIYLRSSIKITHFDIYIHWIWYCFGNYFTYFIPVFKYCYSDSRSLWTVMRAGGLAL